MVELSEVKKTKKIKRRFKMEKQKIVSLIEYFNKANGKRHLTDSDNLHTLIKQAVSEFGEEAVEEVIVNCNEDSIYKVIDRFYIKDYLSKKETPKVVPVQPQNDASGMTIGLLEQALAQVITEKYVPKIADQVIDTVNDFVKRTYGKIEREIEYSYNGKKLEGIITHHEFETVLNFVVADEPIMLVGPAGSGKNVICKQVADLLDLDFYFTNAVTQEYKLTGFKDAMGKYHETEFYKAFKNGGLFMLDEIDASIPETLIMLNAAIANRYFDFPNGRIDAHEDFRIIAAGNTFGHGASYQYVGRNQLDGASLNRFAVLEIDYSRKIEDALSDDKELIEFVRDFRKSVEKSGINHIVSYRELTRMDKMFKGTKMEGKKIVKTCLLKNLEKEDLKIIKSEMQVSNKYSKLV